MGILCLIITHLLRGYLEQREMKVSKRQYVLPPRHRMAPPKRINCFSPDSAILYACVCLDVSFTYDSFEVSAYRVAVNVVFFGNKFDAFQFIE